MAISIDELRINDIVLSPKNDTVRRCMVKEIHKDSVSVEILNMLSGNIILAIHQSTEIRLLFNEKTLLY